VRAAAPAPRPRAKSPRAERAGRGAGGELDYTEFMQGIRGSEFVQTARSYGRPPPLLLPLPVSLLYTHPLPP